MVLILTKADYSGFIILSILFPLRVLTQFIDMIIRTQIDISLATEGDIGSILDIEESLGEGREAAAKEGFLLSGGDTPESYKDFIAYGHFYIAKAESQIVAFFFMLPPNSPRLEKLRASKKSFKMNSEQNVFESKNFAWLAKVGVRSEYMGQGIATQLYEAGLAGCEDWDIMTTTVREPIFNKPSFELQRKFGFEVVGELSMEDRGDLKGIVCDVHLRKV